MAGHSSAAVQPVVTHVDAIAHKHVCVRPSKLIQKVPAHLRRKEPEAVGASNQIAELAKVLDAQVLIKSAIVPTNA